MILLWIHPQHLHKLSHSGIPSHSDLSIILHCILQPLTMLVLLCSCYAAMLRGWLSNAGFFKGPWNLNRINLLQGESSTTFFQQKQSLSYHAVLELTIPCPSPSSLADPQWVQKVKSQVFKTLLTETESFKLPSTFHISSLPQEELIQGGIEQTDTPRQAEDAGFILCEQPVWPTGILHLKKHLWHHRSTDLDWRQDRDSFTITGNAVVNREQAVLELSFLYMLDRECKEHSLVKFIWIAKGVGGLS